MDTTGIHDIVIMFCCCGNPAEARSTEFNQMLQNGWYPATKVFPRTVASLNLLDLYDAIVCEGKLSAFHFYKSLTRLCGTIESISIPVSQYSLSITQCRLIGSRQRRYEEFVRMNQEYQFLKMVQRAGKMFEDDSDTPIGCLAVECPACPQSGCNLPEDWDKGIILWVCIIIHLI